MVSSFLGVLVSSVASEKPFLLLLFTILEVRQAFLKNTRNHFKECFSWIVSKRLAGPIFYEFRVILGVILSRFDDESRKKHSRKSDDKTRSNKVPKKLCGSVDEQRADGGFPSKLEAIVIPTGT